MPTKHPFRRCLALTSALFAFGAALHASQLTFSDTWHDTLAYDAPDQIYFINTVGSFSSSISLPLDGVDLSEVDENTAFSFAIGPSGDTTQIISDTINDAAIYIPGKTSATFLLTDPNFGNTIGRVTVSWNATTLTVSSAASEDILGEEQLFSGDSQGFPTNSPLNTRATGTYYEISVGLDASDNGGGAFNYDNTFVPVAGNDQETDANPPDQSGPYALESGSITGAGDFIPPTITISPKSTPTNLKVNDVNPVVDLVGTASDKFGVTSVQIFVNGDVDNEIDIDQDDLLPTNSLAWTAEIDLSQVGKVGPNVISVVAQDTPGNVGILSRIYYWVETNTVAVSVNPPNSGTVKGIKNGQELLVAGGYVVSASPASKNWIFSDWTDAAADVLSDNASFVYVDEDGTLTNSPAPSLIANFVPNPFTNLDLVGSYTGLFFDTTNGVAPDDSGYIIVGVTASGGLSGKLYLATAAAPFSFSGQLGVAPDGTNATAQFNIKASKSEYLTVNLQIAIDPNLADPGAGLLSGTVNAFSDPTETNLIDSATIQGELSRYNAGTAPGSYNVVLSPAFNDPSQGPGGYGYGSATVSKKGAVTLSLHLPDGVSPAISFSDFLAHDGSCPFYASLYGGKGVILGWLQFATDGSGSLLSQTINWVKMPVADKYYTAGFTAAPTISGGLYLAPKKGSDEFGAGVTALTLQVDPTYAGLDLPDEIDFPVTFNPAKNTFVLAANPDKASLTFSPASGLFGGAFTLPATGKTPLTFHGIVTGGVGQGFYTDAAQKETGPISIVSPGPAPAVESNAGATR